jgi:hypothetical protein
MLLNIRRLEIELDFNMYFSKIKLSTSNLKNKSKKVSKKTYFLGNKKDVSFSRLFL